MRQTTISVPLEVKPESCSRLCALIDELRREEESPPLGYPEEYARIARDVPALHFMSMSVFTAADYDPLFILEANFDGPAGPFWGQLEAALGGKLRALLRCCKRPLNRDGRLFDAVTDSDARAPVAPYLEARAQRPSVYFHGNRGLSRDHILREEALFLGIRDALKAANEGGPSPFRGAPAASVHTGLRDALLPRFPWLGEAAPARVGLAEGLADWLRLGLFAAAALLCLALFGFLILLASDAVRVLLIGGYPLDFAASWSPATRIVVLGLLGLIIAAAVLLLWVRYLEQRDSSQDAPRVNEQRLREMVRREDWIAQNHMGSIVLIKPGVLRTIIIHVGHFALGLITRAFPRYRQGYLGSMRTVHFAHWAFLNNHSRLLFFSNFDHSWDSYLDDFIEKAAVGLTLAWGCGVGFPPTRFLVLEGASHGRRFKSWALASRAVSRFWYSAYKNLTVDQIERNHRIANGLRKQTMTEEEAAAWMLDL